MIAGGRRLLPPTRLLNSLPWSAKGKSCSTSCLTRPSSRLGKIYWILKIVGSMAARAAIAKMSGFLVLLGPSPGPALEVLSLLDATLWPSGNWKPMKKVTCGHPIPGNFRLQCPGKKSGNWNLSLHTRGWQSFRFHNRKFSIEEVCAARRASSCQLVLSAPGSLRKSGTFTTI